MNNLYKKIGFFLCALIIFFAFDAKAQNDPTTPQLICEGEIETYQVLLQVQ
jgi:hypothetical protein